MTYLISSDGIKLSTQKLGARAIDVCFGGDRVWTIDLSDLGDRNSSQLGWHPALGPFLVGHTQVVLRRSDTHEVLAETRVRFTDDEVETRVVDTHGMPLSVNKWGRLGKTLEGENAGVQERILDRTEEVIGQLQELGLRPFVVGGTLLGGVREGRLLPHDDDADIAYLSTHTNPADVAREGFEVGHRLEALGHEIVRHSATHMQLYFRDERGSLDYYVDVFAAFFTEDGHINQPFHVRGPFREEQMLPFGSVEISGRSFPAPADTEAWLVLNYDEDWRTPVPGYRLDTEYSTARRFDSWFGLFNFRREFWDELYADEHREVDGMWRSGREWLACRSDSLAAQTLIDLGSGAGALSVDLANAGSGRRVLAADYSKEALAKVKERAGGSSVETIRLNLYRTNSLGVFSAIGARGSVDVVANHLLDQVGHLARENALRIGRVALRSGGQFLATIYRHPAAEVNYEDPTTWHLAEEQLRSDAGKFGMIPEFQPMEAGEIERYRKPIGVAFRLDGERAESEESMLGRMLGSVRERRRMRALRHGDVGALSKRISELESELDDLRRDNLRVAELMDLVEVRLAPQPEND